MLTLCRFHQDCAGDADTVIRDLVGTATCVA